MIESKNGVQTKVFILRSFLFLTLFQLFVCMDARTQGTEQAGNPDNRRTFESEGSEDLASGKRDCQITIGPALNIAKQKGMVLIEHATPLGKLGGGAYLRSYKLFDAKDADLYMENSLGGERAVYDPRNGAGF